MLPECWNLPSTIPHITTEWHTSTALSTLSLFTCPARQQWHTALMTIVRFDFWVGLTYSFGPMQQWQQCSITLAEAHSAVAMQPKILWSYDLDQPYMQDTDKYYINPLRGWSKVNQFLNVPQAINPENVIEISPRLLLSCWHMQTKHMNTLQTG